MACLSLVTVHRFEDFTPEDPPHDWDSAHDQWRSWLERGETLGAVRFVR